MIKYNFSESIFQTIDSPEKAYWLGFLYADGSISGNSNSVYLALKEEDNRGERSQTRGKHFRYMTKEEKEEMRKNE